MAAKKTVKRAPALAPLGLWEGAKLTCLTWIASLPTRLFKKEVITAAAGDTLQDIVAEYACVKALASAASKAQKAFETHYLSLYPKGDAPLLVIEATAATPGLELSIKTSMTGRPSWKNEATKLAEKLCLERGASFNLESYLESVANAYTQSVRYSVSLVESAYLTSDNEQQHD